MNKTKQGILVVSFGTTHEDTRKITIEKIEKHLAAAFPECSVYRAWTSRMIIKRLWERDQLIVDTVPEALKRMAADGITSVIIQPTHILNGVENDRMKADALTLSDLFEKMAFADPLLTSQEDMFRAADMIAEHFPEISENTALVLMGHGTEHYVNTIYAALDYIFKDRGHDHIYVGTVEAYPSLETVMAKLKKHSYKKVILTPFMIVAGDHAKNDMAGDEADSWKSQLVNAGYDVECVLKGLGEYKEVSEILAEHCRVV